MKKLQSLFILVLVLISGYARSQCVNVRFSSTATTWPTVNALPTYGVNKTQFLCLQQNLVAPAAAATTVFLSSPSGVTVTNWEVIGTGITLTGLPSNTQCTFQLNAAPATPFDFGKIRIAVRYSNGVCGCVDTLDIFRVMSPALTTSFANIQGQTCLVPGAKANFLVEPRFSKPTNIGLGIGIDGYTWSVLDNATGGVGTWFTGNPNNSTLSMSGDSSALEIQSPILGWINSTATIRVKQGSRCNNVQSTLLVQKGAPTATITATLPNALYTITNNGTQVVTACLNAGPITTFTTPTQPITLTAPPARASTAGTTTA